MEININISVSREDIRTLREMAEIKDVQNFVSLTPTINVQLQAEHYKPEELANDISDLIRREIRDSTEIYFYDQKDGLPVIGTVKIDGTRIASAIDKANKALEQMLE